MNQPEEVVVKIFDLNKLCRRKYSMVVGKKQVRSFVLDAVGKAFNSFSRAMGKNYPCDHNMVVVVGDSRYLPIEYLKIEAKERYVYCRCEIRVDSKLIADKEFAKTLLRGKDGLYRHEYI